MSIKNKETNSFNCYESDCSSAWAQYLSNHYVSYFRVNGGAVSLKKPVQLSTTAAFSHPLGDFFSKMTVKIKKEPIIVPGDDERHVKLKAISYVCQFLPF